MNFKQRITLVVITILFAVVSGCQNKEAQRKDPLDENYKLIDRGSYTDAIESLKVLSLTDKRPQVLVALGSAYAARGGIKVAQYWGFVVGFKAPLITFNDVNTNSTAERLQRIVKQTQGQVEEKDMKALGDLLQTLAVWDQYQERVAAIPLVTGKALEDLHQAVNVLAAVQTPGGRLYRAILNLILFKSYITNSQDFWKDFNGAIGEVIGGDVQVLCKFDFENLLKWLNPISYHLIETLTDLTIAFPESQKEFVAGRNLVRAVQSTTKDAIQDLRDLRMCE